MPADSTKPTILITPTMAKKELDYILERVQTTGERFLIVRRRQPEAVLLGIGEFLKITGRSQEWIDEVWKAAQES